MFGCFYIFDTSKNEVVDYFFAKTRDEMVWRLEKLFFEEVRTYIPSRQVLDAKIDWFENQHGNMFNESIVYSQASKCFYPIDIQDIIYGELVRTWTYSMFMKFIHTNVESATAPPLKYLHIYRF